MNKNKNTIHNQKHLTLIERTYIEQELVQGSSFSSIASVLTKDPSTISKEVKRACITESAGYTGKCHACQNYGDCFRKSICGDWCKWRCCNCYKKNPTQVLSMTVIKCKKQRLNFVCLWQHEMTCVKLLYI